MYTTTRNTKKKRSKRTNTTKSIEIKHVKPWEQNWQSTLSSKLCFTVILFDISSCRQVYLVGLILNLKRTSVLLLSLTEFSIQNPVIPLYKILMARCFVDEIFHHPVTFYPVRSSPYIMNCPLWDFLFYFFNKKEMFEKISITDTTSSIILTKEGHCNLGIYICHFSIMPPNDAFSNMRTRCIFSKKDFSEQ